MIKQHFQGKLARTSFEKDQVQIGSSEKAKCRKRSGVEPERDDHFNAGSSCCLFSFSQDLPIFQIRLNPAL